jgi:hypothetical protein
LTQLLLKQIDKGSLTSSPSFNTTQSTVPSECSRCMVSVSYSTTKRFHCDRLLFSCDCLHLVLGRPKRSRSAVIERWWWSQKTFIDLFQQKLWQTLYVQLLFRCCTCICMFMKIITRPLYTLYHRSWYAHSVIIFYIPFNLHGINWSCL